MSTGYICEHLNPQITYYENKSKIHQRRYYALSVANIVIVALIPILSLLVEPHEVQKILTACLGAVSTMISSILMLLKPKDTWVEYRATCEQLKSEKARYTYCAGPYKDGSGYDRDSLFVETCEEIMRKEHSSWSARVKSAPDQNKE